MFFYWEWQTAHEQWRSYFLAFLLSIISVKNNVITFKWEQIKLDIITVSFSTLFLHCFVILHSKHSNSGRFSLDLVSSIFASSVTLTLPCTVWTGGIIPVRHCSWVHAVWTADCFWRYMVFTGQWQFNVRRLRTETMFTMLEVNFWTCLLMLRLFLLNEYEASTVKKPHSDWLTS